MSECLGNDGQVHVAGVGDACPAVPWGVGGERGVDAGKPGDALEASVVAAQERAEPSPSGFLSVGFAEDGEYKSVLRPAVSADDGGHAGLDAQPDGAPRLASAVHDDAVRHLRTAQRCHVGKGHSLSVEGEEEQVEGESHAGVASGVERPQASDAVRADAALGRGDIAGERSLERRRHGTPACRGGLVADGTQRPQVAGGSVGGDAAAEQPPLEVPDRRGIDCGDGQVGHAGMEKERPDGREVVAARGGRYAAGGKAGGGKEHDAAAGLRRRKGRRTASGRG